MIRRFLPVAAVVLLLPASAASQDVLSPRDSLLLIHADSVLARGEPSRAIGIYRDIISRNPESFRPRYGIAKAFLNQGDPDRALPYLNELIDDFPAEADPRVLRGYGFLQQGRLTNAEADFRWVVDRFPEYSDAWQGLGIALERSGELRRAIEVYNRWITVDPDDPQAFLARARLLASLGRSAEARADLERARQLNADAEGLDRVEAVLEVPGWHDEVEIATAYEVITFFGEREHWESYSASAQYSVPRHASGSIEYTRARRFSTDDDAIRINLNVNLWRRSSLQAIWQHSRHPEFLPRDDLYVELHQPVQEGWVPSVFYRHMAFPAVKADFYGAGLEKYADPWYGRIRFALVDARNRKDPVLMTQLRYYFSPDTYVSTHFGYGSEIVTVGLGPEILIGTNVASSILLHTFFTRHFGFAIASSYTHSKVLPNHAGANIRLMARF